MRSHAYIRAALVLSMMLGTGIVTDAQTNWPTSKTDAPTVSSPVNPRKPTRRRKARPRPVAAPIRETALLRSMAELITRQAATIDVLTRRLDAADARLAAVARAVSEAPRDREAAHGIRRVGSDRLRLPA